MSNIKSWQERSGKNVTGLMDDEITDLRTALAERDALITTLRLGRSKALTELTTLRAVSAERDSVVANLQKAYDDLYAESTRDVTTLRAAATQGLEALIETRHSIGYGKRYDSLKATITALQSALGGPTT